MENGDESMIEKEIKDKKFYEDTDLNTYNKVYKITKTTLTYLSECSRPYELSEREKALVDFIYWARNRGAGKEGAIKINLRPGPRGFKSNNGWFPSPSEGCDCLDVKEFIPYFKKPNKGISQVEDMAQNEYPSLRRDYWAWWKHCKSRQHIIYLIKHRLDYVYNKILSPHTQYVMGIIVPAITNGALPLLINDTRPVVKAFVRDALNGKAFDIKEHMCQSIPAKS